MQILITSSEVNLTKYWNPYHILWSDYNTKWKLLSYQHEVDLTRSYFLPSSCLLRCVRWLPATEAWTWGALTLWTCWSHLLRQAWAHWRGTGSAQWLRRRLLCMTSLGPGEPVMWNIKTVLPSQYVNEPMWKSTCWKERTA